MAKVERPASQATTVTGCPASRWRWRIARRRSGPTSRATRPVTTRSTSSPWRRRRARAACSGVISRATTAPTTSGIRNRTPRVGSKVAPSLPARTAPNEQQRTPATLPPPRPHPGGPRAGRVGRRGAALQPGSAPRRAEGPRRVVRQGAQPFPAAAHRVAQDHVAERVATAHRHVQRPARWRRCTVSSRTEPAEMRRSSTSALPPSGRTIVGEHMPVASSTATTAVSHSASEKSSRTPPTQLAAGRVGGLFHSPPAADRAARRASSSSTSLPCEECSTAPGRSASRPSSWSRYQGRLGGRRPVAVLPRREPTGDHRPGQHRGDVLALAVGGTLARVLGRGLVVLQGRRAMAPIIGAPGTPR